MFFFLFLFCGVYGTLVWYDLAGPYYIDMRTRMFHWAPGLSDWKLNTSTTVLCAMGPLQVRNSLRKPSSISIDMFSYKIVPKSQSTTRDN
jgi:hypothetical protein